jgi:hypothetical protein
MSGAEGLLVNFIFRVGDHPQLGATHISLYAALVGLFQLRGEEPVLIKRGQVMALAKMSPATYHKCLRALIECGFLVYYPCPDPKGMSQIYFRRDPPEKDPGSAGVQLEKR